MTLVCEQEFRPIMKKRGRKPGRKPKDENQRKTHGQNLFSKGTKTRSKVTISLLKEKIPPSRAPDLRRRKTKKPPLDSLPDKRFTVICCCLTCNKEFPYALWQRHSKSKKHKKFETKYKCNRCKNRFFPTRNRIIIHQISHTDERPYQCQNCPKAFKDKYRLRTHQAVHSEDSPFGCFCGKFFKSKDRLRVSELTLNCFGKDLLQN